MASVSPATRMTSGGPTGSMGRSKAPAVTRRVCSPSASRGPSTQWASARHRTAPAREATSSPPAATTTSRRMAVSRCTLARARSASSAPSRAADATRKPSKRRSDSSRMAGVAAFAPPAPTTAMIGSADVWRHSAARRSVSVSFIVRRGSRRMARWRRCDASISSARPRSNGSRNGCSAASAYPRTPDSWLSRALRRSRTASTAGSSRSTSRERASSRPLKVQVVKPSATRPRTPMVRKARPTRRRRVTPPVRNLAGGRPTGPGGRLTGRRRPPGPLPPPA